MARHPEVLQPTRASRATDIVRQAVNRGKPLPLQVMLEAMWGLRDEARRLADLPPTDRAYNPQRARATLLAAVSIAEKAAPYVHPKLANVAVRPEDDEEAQSRRASQETVRKALAGASIDDLSKIWMSLAKGDEGELSEALGGQPQGVIEDLRGGDHAGEEGALDGDDGLRSDRGGHDEARDGEGDAE